jgi:signal peptidase I
MTKQHKSTHTLFSVFTTIELVIVAALFAAIVLPLPFGIKPSIVMTGSMEPTVSTGSIAWIDQNFTEDDLEVGTIAVYEPQLGTEVMHRIIAIDGDTYTFQGDNNNAPDLAEPTAENVEGVYLFHVPEVGKTFSWFMDNKIPILLFLAGINLAVYVVSALLVRRADKVNTPIERKEQ